MDIALHIGICLAGALTFCGTLMGGALILCWLAGGFRDDESETKARPVHDNPRPTIEREMI